MKQTNRTLSSKISEIRLSKHISFSSWLLLVIAFSFIGGYSKEFFIAYFVAFLHEMAHILCARFLKISVEKIILYPFGITARLSSGYIKNSEKEFFISFSGPFVNLILFWASTALKFFWNASFLSFFADVNLAIALVNLIPALPLDGGRMVKAILTSRYGIIKAYNAMINISRVLTISMGVVAIYVFFASSFNFSLILISAFLFQNLGDEQISLSHIALGEIIENKQKLKDNFLMKTKSFSVSEDSYASIILKHLSYDYFSVIHVVDKSARITKSLTESQILDELSEHGATLKFSEIA